MLDSGIGGLTLFNQFIKHLNCVTYLADNRYFPYGIKEDVDLINIIDRLIFYFLNRQYKKVILACNTASYVYHKYLKYKYKDLVVSIIENTVDDLENVKKLNRVGMIATKQVVESHIYDDLIYQKYQVQTISKAASELVCLCENNNTELIKQYLQNHLQDFKKENIDVLILGCTHFNLIEKEIKDFFNHQLPVICSGYSIVNQFILNDLCLMCNKNKIYLTKYEQIYVEKIKRLFNDLKNIKIQALNI